MIARIGLRLAVGLAAIGAALLPAGAQMSPNCERNGRRDYCAFTPAAGGTGSSGWLVFADHRVYALELDLASCRERGPERICKAWIRVRPDNRAIPATYRGTAYEGGYRHLYSAPGLRLSYGFLD